MIAALLFGPLGMALLVGGACSSCSHAGTQPPPEPPPTDVAAAQLVRRANTCAAGGLPRFSEKNLVEADVPAVLAAAAKGPIAVIHSAAGVRLVKDCRLSGEAYPQIPGKGANKAQFRPASRLVYRADEVAGACEAATHVVAALGVDGTTKHLQGILVPLPCPSVADPNGAPGCIAKGATGSERRGRAAAVWKRLPRGEGAFGDLAVPLELYALVPDHFWGLSFSHWIKERTLLRQATWLFEQYELGKIVPPRGQEDWMVDLFAVDPGVEPPVAKLKEAARRAPPPVLYWNPVKREVIQDPAFMDCFPTLVDPEVRQHVIQ